ncbi:MAG: hypothetical protein IJ763_09560 [Lachnospiraceae bacterium]|nr:hypothetical protein [Lachnospiraceae bacterium]
MFLFGILVASAIATETYFIAYKRHIENVSIASYMVNFVFLIMSVLIFATKWNDEIFTNMPRRTLVLYGIIMAVGMAVSFTEWLCLKQHTIDIKLIKNMVDGAAQGILVLKDRDKVIFQNSVMYWLLDSLDIHADYVNMIKKASKKTIDREYLLLIDDCAWLFGISDDGNEITATDIDEEYKLQEKLEEQNEIINRNNEELEYLIENMEELEKEDNSLRIKNKFHDIMGQNLSVLQAYLNQDIEDMDRFREVKFMIKKMFTDLSDTDDAALNLDNLVRINKNIGVDVEINGGLPEDNEKAKVLLEIIREAVTNAINHADSTRVMVDIENTADNTQMTITNNGRKPREIISENEGIKGMRRKVRTIDGSLTIKTIPEFAISVNIPE